MKLGVTQKYLEGYAEPEARAVSTSAGVWAHVVCIPACREQESLLPTLQTLRRARDAEQALVILVVNGAENASDAVHTGNAQTADLLSETCGVGSAALAWGALDGMAVLVVDRWSEGRRLPAGQGVGLARKIGADLALALVEQGAVAGPWIRCTDADVEVPLDYFETLSQYTEGDSAAVYPFEHVAEGDALQQEAVRLYEAYLHYYVDGLRSAGSPYAFHTIGSLIAVHAHAYAAVRGFPKRAAGEDFYLLNKLAKVGPVVSLQGEAVRIRGRVSDRVPFGTGVAVQKIRADLAAGRPYLVYDPRVFEALSVWQAGLKAFSEQPDLGRLRASIRQSPLSFRDALYQTLGAQGAFAAAQAASEQVSGPRLWRRLMEWNDAFRTLKLIHGVRDLAVGEVPIERVSSP